MVESDKPRHRPSHRKGEPKGSSESDQRRRKHRIVALLRYRFDQALGRGPLVVVGYLGIIMFAIIFIAAAIDTVFSLTGISGNPHGVKYSEAFWQSTLRLLDTGTFASDASWPTRILSLIVTLSGIFIAGSLIGLIATALDQQIANLRKGRSAVLETDHTLVLGWSPRLPVIISELAIANENRKRPAVVVLADRPKDEMEDDLRRLVADSKNTRIVCRTGDPGTPADLHLVGVMAARSVIVLAGEDGDAGVVKAVLAIRSIDPHFEKVRLVAELENKDHAATLASLTKGRIGAVHADDVISRVTAQACHQAGLASVFRDLLDFDGDEIYFKQVPELAGSTYLDALTAFETSSVLGICTDNKVELNPPMNRVFSNTDEVIAVASDDGALVFTGFTGAGARAERPTTEYVPPPRRIAMIGWSALGSDVLGELDQFLTRGSVIDLLIDDDIIDEQALELPPHTHCEVNVHFVAPNAAAVLAVLHEHVYDQAIVLGYREGLTPAQADARTMLTVLAMTESWRDDPHRPRVVAEMLDRSNVDVAQTIGLDDFIISDELSSLMMAQLSERLELKDVFTDFFDAEGCFISLHPAGLYTDGGPTTFGALVMAAAAYGQTALGYRRNGMPVVLNPAKSTQLQLALDDQVLVLGPRSIQPAPVLEKKATTDVPAPVGDQQPLAPA